jgi:hypothetical protein
MTFEVGGRQYRAIMTGSARSPKAVSA